MMAALTASRAGNHVMLVEKNNKLGKKLFLTGKGRCNLTNSCDMEELFANVVTNSKFLYSSFYDLSNQDTISLFEELGLKMKVERGNRVFPLSDHSSDVIKVLERALSKTGVCVLLNSCVVSILSRRLDESEKTDVKSKFNHQITGVKLSNGTEIKADAIIMATGGASYPSTGSDGTSFDLLKSFDITVTQLKPALVPLRTKEEFVYDMSGLSLKNVGVSLVCDGKEIFSDFGEMLFTHFGVSGPLILSASSYLNGRFYKKEAKLFIDLKPALNTQMLDDRILRDFGEVQNRLFKNSLSGLLPSKMISSVITLSEICPDKQVNCVTKEERLRLVNTIKNYPLTIVGDRGFEEAIITSGGVGTKEINPSTMECKKVKGLYFAGEMIDVDAKTGGFNLQIAWSSGHLAGQLGG